MIRIRLECIVLFALPMISPAIAHAQNPPPKFGTPEGTSALAATAGFIDILDIKLGMPAETAMAMLKKEHPGAKISLERTRDYESLWYNVERPNPNHLWVSTIDLVDDGTGEKIFVGLTLPPTKQVVQAVGRELFFKQPVGVENIVAGLRKKYGPETYGVDSKLGPVAAFDGMEKRLLWVFDTQGNREKPEPITKNVTICLGGIAGNMSGAELTLQKSRPYDSTLYTPSPCLSFVILTASIQMASVSPGISGQATGFNVVAYDWPLLVSGAQALYAFLDQGARDLAAKQAADAKKRGTDIKY
jgi:hypothetical protein